MPDSKTLHLSVITPSRPVFDGAASSVVVPAFDGELGILPGHAALLALLSPGELRATAPDGQVTRFAIRGGMVQINRDEVSVLTPEAAAKEELAADAVEDELEKLDIEKPAKLAEREQHDARRAWVKAQQRVLKHSQ
jgi:F-type H+-transporting ATPase subunit epsilon